MIAQTSVMSLPLPSVPVPVPVPVNVSGISSPTLATPKPHSISLHPILLADGRGIVPEILKNNNDAAQRDTNDHADGQRVLLDGDADGSNQIPDGRLTPTADSNQSSASSGLSHDPPSPNPTTISTFSQSTEATRPPLTFTANITHPAEVGLGVLLGEEQLKTALQSKDRMFILVLAKELEAFVNRVALGQATNASQALVQGATTSALAALGPSTPIAVVPTSKFQRMLVYKAAEWYGLKAVAGPDGSMIAGVLGAFNEKSIGLRLSELVPAAPSPTQKFRIMQRSQPNSNESVDGTSDSGAGDSRQPRWKSLEEREAAYALAREKIYGKAAAGLGGTTENETVDGDAARVDGDRDRTIRGVVDDDEMDPVPRRRPPNTNTQFDNIVYPSLYHPPKAEPPPPPTPTVQDQYSIQQPAPYPFQSSSVPYPSYPQTDMNGYPLVGQMANTYAPPQQIQQQPYGMIQQSYMSSVPSYLGQQPQMDGYAQQRWQPALPLNGPYPSQAVSQSQPYNLVPNQQNGMGQNWGYAQMPQQNQPMPMIPQGMTYPPPYGYSQQASQPQPPRQGTYPPLVHPTPTRPQPHPHSSASSSISSRSYQSYHESSRPHSRGSTTSTRSAASSVRLGAIYPANQGPGFRQPGMMGQGLNGLTSIGSNGEPKRSHRGHSPSSTTTTSSRSSRHASSIQLPQPAQGQHQLPQRPDWAKRNVPYHPSPMPNGPSSAEFPPLMPPRHGTNAEPMQVEKAKTKPSGTVWNGHVHHPSISNHASFTTAIGHIPSPAATSSKFQIVPGPHSHTPHPPSASTTSVQYQSSQQSTEVDPDFPRRIPSKTAPTLYDPSAPKSTPSVNGASSAVGSNAESRPPSVSNNSVTIASLAAAALSPEEIIEAKLAAVSINAGVSIGPPPTRTGTTSYAKIVRRD